MTMSQQNRLIAQVEGINVAWITVLVQTATVAEVDGATFDPAALRAKYAQERQRRLRGDGISQYVQVAGAFSRFGRDPWADPDFTATRSATRSTSPSSVPASAGCSSGPGAGNSVST